MRHGEGVSTHGDIVCTCSKDPLIRSRSSPKDKSQQRYNGVSTSKEPAKRRPNHCNCSSIPVRSASVQFLYAFTNLTCVLVYDIMTLCVENNG